MEAQANSSEVTSDQLTIATANSSSSQGIFGTARSMHVDEISSTKYLDGHGRRMTSSVRTALPDNHGAETIEQNHIDVHRFRQQDYAENCRAKSCPAIQSGMLAPPSILEAGQFAARTFMTVEQPGTTIVAKANSFDLHAGTNTVFSPLL
jgi:hypothetical protein